MYVGRVSLSERKQFMSNVRARRRISSFQIIILGFAGVILLGALLLMLPVSTRSGVVTPFTDALFTSTSAVCVTGLVVRDTGSLLVDLRSIGDNPIDTDWRTRSNYGGGGVFAAIRAKDLAAAAQYHAGCYLCAAGGRHRPADPLCNYRNIYGRACRCTAADAVTVFAIRREGVWMSFFHAISAFCNAGI